MCCNPKTHTGGDDTFLLEKLESGHKNLKAKIKAQKKRDRKKASAKRSPKRSKHRQDKEGMAEQDGDIVYEPATAVQMTSFLSPKIPSAQGQFTSPALALPLKLPPMPRKGPTVLFFKGPRGAAAKNKKKNKGPSESDAIDEEGPAVEEAIDGPSSATKKNRRKQPSIVIDASDGSDNEEQSPEEDSEEAPSALVDADEPEADDDNSDAVTIAALRKKTGRLMGQHVAIKATTAEGQTYKLASGFARAFAPGINGHIEAEHVLIERVSLCHKKSNHDWSFTNGHNCLVSCDGTQMFETIRAAVDYANENSEGIYAYAENVFVN